MERVALGLPVGPGNETRVARLLRRLAPAQAGEVRTEAVATFTAPGRVLHIADTTGGLDGLVADLTAHPDVAAGLRELCGMPHRLTVGSYLIRARLTRWAHYARPYPARLPVHRRALLYPVRPGKGEELRRLLAAGIAPGTSQKLASALISSTVFARQDLVVRFWEATADPAEELDNIARVVPRSGLGAKLNRLLHVEQDLTTDAGFRTFFTGCAMSPVPGAGAWARP
jgi:hypothetical protein